MPRLLKVSKAALVIAASTKYGKKPDNATERRMRKYLLAKRAKDDLIAIAQYGDEHFGVALHDESGFDTSERIKLTLRTAYKLFELRPTPDFAGRDWTQAKWALRKRHLLMHPKTPADMDIPDDLWKQLAPAMDWLIDQHFTFLKLLIAKVPALQRR